MKIISTCKNPVRVGSVVIKPNVTTDVPKKDLDAFIKTNYGKSFYKLFIKKISAKNRSKK